MILFKFPLHLNRIYILRMDLRDIYSKLNEMIKQMARSLFCKTAGAIFSANQSADQKTKKAGIEKRYQCSSRGW